MSDQAQRVLDALMEFDSNFGVGYPIYSIYRFFTFEISRPVKDGESTDYENLTADEEKQVIKKFLEFAY